MDQAWGRINPMNCPESGSLLFSVLLAYHPWSSVMWRGVSLTHRCVGQGSVSPPGHLHLGSISSESAVGLHFLDNFSFSSKCAKKQYGIMAERVSCPIRSFWGRSPLPLPALWLQMNPFTFSASQFSHGDKWRWHCPSHRSEDNSLSAQVTEELNHKFSNLPQPSIKEYFSYMF